MGDDFHRRLFFGRPLWCQHRHLNVRLHERMLRAKCPNLVPLTAPATFLLLRPLQSSQLGSIPSFCVVKQTISAIVRAPNEVG